MSELGYFEPIPGIYGTANPATDSDPVSRAALQEATIQAQIARAGLPGAVPPSYQGPDPVGPRNQQVGGPSNLPIVGWTCQNSTGPAFQEPYTADGMGHIPNWTGDANSAGGGAYDQNEVYTGAFAYDRNATAPRGDGLLQFDDRPNPNAPTTDVSGGHDY